MNDILSIDYKDWFINQKRIPDKESEEYKRFFDFHKEICLNGCMMGDTFINPFLYWHLNIWHTEVDYIDERGKINQKYANPLLRDNEWIVTNEIERAHNERKGLVILGIRRFAKALRNNELLYTSDGSIQIGNAKIGDRIYDHNGELTTITGVFPQGKIPVYKMSFEDGRVIHCCENHIWKVKDRRYNKIKELSVKELFPIYKKPRIHNGYKDKITRNIEECFFAIPNNSAVTYPEKHLPIDPYFLGLWLGDGNSRNLGITTIDKEVKEFIYNYADQLSLKVRVDGDSYFITSGIKGGTLDYNNLTNQFKKLDLLKNKHIPDIYLYSSIEQRIALLQGLMDTDGSVYKNGTITFVSTNEKLAECFYSLCRSLGISIRKKSIRTKLYGVDCGEGWLFHLYTEQKIFRLPRKLANFKHGNKGKQAKIFWTTIRNIELVEEDYATCITVDNNDKLFLTTDYTVTHNSVIEASYIAWGATFDENSQNVIVGLNSPDIKLITDKLDKGLNFVPDAWRWQRVEDNWKNQVTLGIKTRSGERIPFSQILIRNLDEGHNEEAIAGTKPRKLIIDEIGKGSFLRGLQAAMPGFTTPYGWTCSPILTGTGGDMTKFMDAMLLMFDVENFNFLTYRNERDENRIHGLFLSYKYRMEAKEPSTLGKFLEKPDNSPLHEIPMLVSNEEKAKKITDDNLARLRKAGDRIAYLKEKMYYPVEVDDIFLNENTNIFDIDGARRQKHRLQEQERTGTPVILYQDENGNVKHEFTDKLPITNFPIRHGDRKDAPIVIYEFPVESPPYGLYTAGCLIPGEKVMTEFGLKNVEDIDYKVKLINESGSLVDIKALLRYDKNNEDIYTIKVSNTIRTTTFTKEHPILVTKPYTNSDKTLHEKNFKFKYVNVSDVSVGDWIKFPNIYRDKNNFDIRDLWRDDKVRIDRQIENPLNKKDFWWFIGLWLGDGWCDKKTGKITIVFNKEDTLYINKFKNVVSRLFNRDIYIRERSAVECTISFRQLSEFLTEYFGKYALNKLIPEWVKRIDKEYKQQLLLGYLDSDGCISREKKRGYYTLEFVSINLGLLEAIQDISFSLGYISGITEMRSSTIYSISNKKPSKINACYHLRFGHNDTIKIANDLRDINNLKLLKIDLNNLPTTVKRSNKGCFISKDQSYIFFKIKDIIKSNYTGIVYNFECDTHTFLCHHITTHNCDPYRQGQAAYSNSLGTVYIYKRMHDIMGEKYQDMFVASYAARPDKKDTWEEQARLLIKYYNARTLCENDDISFIEYMKAKGDAHYLERQPDWLKEIVPNTTVNRDYGVHRSAIKIIDFLHTCLKKYTEETIFVEKDANGEIVKEILGMNKILDPVLLEEMIQYNEEGNFDRIVAAELAIAQAIKMDPILGRVAGSDDPRIKALYVKRVRPTLFPNQISAFSRRKQKLFV